MPVKNSGGTLKKNVMVSYQELLMEMKPRFTGNEEYEQEMVPSLIIFNGKEEFFSNAFISKECYADSLLG